MVEANVPKTKCLPWNYSTCLTQENNLHELKHNAIHFAKDCARNNHYSIPRQVSGFTKVSG